MFVHCLKNKIFFINTQFLKYSNANIFYINILSVNLHFPKLNYRLPYCVCISIVWHTKHSAVNNFKHIKRLYGILLQC